MVNTSDFLLEGDAVVMDSNDIHIRIGHSPDPDDAFMFHALTTGAIQTPAILQRSGITCGNTLYDHAGFTLLYKKQTTVTVDIDTNNTAGTLSFN